MKKIISVVSVVAIVLVLFVWGKTNQAASEAGNGEVATTTTSTLSFPLTFHDFGTISMAAGKASKEFPVVNNTGRDLILERVETSCMCTSAYIKNGENRISHCFGGRSHYSDDSRNSDERIFLQVPAFRHLYY